ncbi:MAG: hypothetical protein AAF502_09145 [Bacteroidota bacterium]
MKRFLLPSILIGLGAILTALSFLIGSGGGNGTVDIEIEKASFIMPAAHNVYSNSEALDGKYYLFKAKLTNPTKATLEDVTVSYRVPGFIEWTEIAVIGEMFEGQTASVVCYPKFKDDIVEKMTESMEKAEIEVTWDGADDDDIVEEDFAFKIVDRNLYMFTGIPGDEIAGWSDVYDNDALLACFVTPNDPIVKYYTQVVQEKVLKGDQASVSQNPQDAARFLMGIYEATRMSHMVYSGTKGIPQSLDDVSSFSQHNRLPREVITGNTGLCLELSLLYASMMSAAGLNPIIFLVPGHAYPGFEMKGTYYAIEATKIGGEGLGGIGSVQEALESGEKQLQEWFKMAQMGDPRYTMVNVHELNQQGVVPMALKDDEFMRQKVKEIGEKFEPTVSENAKAPKKNTPRNNNPRPRPDNASNDNTRVVDSNPNSRRTSGPLSFAIPASWTYSKYPFPEVPIATAAAMSPDMTANAIIYDIPASSIDEALAYLYETLYYMGSEVAYQRNGSSITGETYSAYGTFRWKGKAKRTGSGVRIVATGANDMTYGQHSGTINSIYKSIR